MLVTVTTALAALSRYAPRAARKRCWSHAAVLPSPQVAPSRRCAVEQAGGVSASARAASATHTRQGDYCKEATNESRGRQRLNDLCCRIRNLTLGAMHHLCARRQ